MTPLPPQPIVLVGPANESDQCYVVAARAKQQAGVMQVGLGMHMHGVCRLVTRCLQRCAASSGYGLHY